ncbi:MAG: hypothetical protein ABII12_08370 [Planctomycetota bacterium]
MKNNERGGRSAGDLMPITTAQTVWGGSPVAPVSAWDLLAHVERLL